MIDIRLGDCLDVLKTLPDGAFTLVYVDPPFNTGQVQKRVTTRSVPDPGGRLFGGRLYRSEVVAEQAWTDRHDDYLGFLMPRLAEGWRVLSPRGSMFVHLDAREVHHVKVACDTLFGRDHFLNEIIWAYDYGGRSRSRWSAKHDNILWYVKDPTAYIYNYDEIDRIPYMAPGLVGPEKAARGKTPTDVWWHTIVSPTGREKTGYPTQKPVGVLRRIVRVHSNPGDRVLDFFAGSGSFGAAAEGRDCVLVDSNPAAVDLMRRRLGVL